ncbi:MAG: carboxymuconolactone decarboxylase family protein [Deltaproteobacteria bacterium]|nr:carboxymuconolactone decarboxylase family protein [Deltaproteobacteria bacterium]
MAANTVTFEEFRSAIPEYAKDVRVNLGVVLSAEGAPDLSEDQINGIALASAYATRSKNLIAAIENKAEGVSEAIVNAAKAASAIMAMNNIYYRFTHLVEDEEISSLPAKLRMTVIANPGIPRPDFELMSLAVSAINGCGMCMKAHARELGKHGLSKSAIQSAVRIASVLNSSAQVAELA